MNRLSARGQILVYSPLTGSFSGFLASEYRDAMGALYERVPHGAVWALEFGRWYPRRSTGPESQCNHFHGHCQTIAEDTGEELGRVKLIIKRRAMKRGYPTMVDEKGNIVFSRFDGEVLPQSESLASTEQENMLIEETHQVAAEMNIRLIEKNLRKE